MPNEAKRHMTKPKIIRWLKGSLESPDIHADIDFLVRILEGKTLSTAASIDIYLTEYEMEYEEEE